MDMPTLYIMRHGKAENTAPDIERRLTHIGIDNVKSVANNLRDSDTSIEKVIYSSATRAKQTAMLMCEGLSIPIENQTEDARIYNASVSELKEVIAEIDGMPNSVLLVGHNPGFADLVLDLCQEGVHFSAGNLALVHAESWQDIRSCKCRLIEKI